MIIMSDPERPEVGPTGPIPEGEPTESGQEQIDSPELISVPKTLTQDHFWRAIAGREAYTPPTEEQLEEIARSQIEQNAPPLTELNPDETNVVNQVFLKSLKNYTNHDNHRDLVRLVNNDQLCFFNKTVIDMPPQGWPALIEILPVHGGYRYTFYKYKPDLDLDRKPKNVFEEKFDLPKARKFAAKHGISTNPLTKQQVVRYLIDPKIWGETGVEGIGGLTLQGIRSAAEYGYSEKKVKTTFAAIREQTSHHRLRVLDVGGGSGYALSEMQEIDPDIETINLTIDEEPSSFRADKLLLLPAEFMPEELEETVDFAISRTAFRYFPFPDVALKNIAKSLTIGGFADIHFSAERSALLMIRERKTYEEAAEELNSRIRSVILWLKKLEDEGYLETNIPDEGESGGDKYDRDLGLALKIRKLKSIKGLGDK